MCSNNDYLICGNSNGGIGGDKTTPGFGARYLWLIRTDSLGNKLWDQTYGGNADELALSNTEYFISENIDGSLLVSGRTLSSQSGTVTRTSWDFVNWKSPPAGRTPESPLRSPRLNCKYFRC